MNLSDSVNGATSPVYDADILFNPPAWNALIETQQALFRTRALESISDRLRREFYLGHAPNRKMPVIGTEDWETALLGSYLDRPLGYDLPCLLSAEHTPKGRIMLCAQDPLRGMGPAQLTVGTFFGIDSQYHRTRRHWGMIWQLIRDCVLAGYDVWVTDAIKLYAGKNAVWQDAELRELCLSIVRDEVAAFQPDRLIAFGAWAGVALSEAGLKSSVIRVPHPTARGQSGTMQKRLEHYREIVLP